MQSLFKQTPHAQIFKRVLLFIFAVSSGLFAWVKTARFGPMELDLNKLQEVNGGGKKKSCIVPLLLELPEPHSGSLTSVNIC